MSFFFIWMPFSSFSCRDFLDIQNQSFSLFLLALRTCRCMSLTLRTFATLPQPSLSACIEHRDYLEMRMRGLFSFFLSIYTAISMFKALIHGILCPQEHQSSTKCILHISFPAISFNLFNKLIACFNHYHHLMWLNVQYLSPIVLWQMLSQPQGKDFSHCVSSKSI